MVAATIRTVFVQPDPKAAREQWRRVADSFRGRFAKLAHLLDEAETDVLAYLAFPTEHWRQIWSNNTLDRLNREVKRSLGPAPCFRGRRSARSIGRLPRS
jgi:transposase-like protein